MQTFLLAIFVPLLSIAPVANAPASVFGDWRTPGGSVVRVGHCGPDVCLTVVRLPQKASNTTDAHNPDAQLRERPLCGLMIGSGFHEDDDVHLTGGHLYDPRSGSDYRSTITALGDTLRLRGYIGISLFGRSEVWKRSPEVQACR